VWAIIVWELYTIHTRSFGLGPAGSGSGSTVRDRPRDDDDVAGAVLLCVFCVACREDDDVALLDDAACDDAS